MRKVIIFFVLMLLLSIPVEAAEYEAPQTPDSAWEYLPENTENFWDGVSEILRNAIGDISPAFADAINLCTKLIVIQILIVIADNITEDSSHILSVVGAVGSGVILLQSSSSMIASATQTISDICEYGKLLFPVLAAALTAQGGTVTSSTLLIGTIALETVFTSIIVKMIIPGVMAYLAINIVGAAFHSSILQSAEAGLKSAMTWVLKAIVFIFTTYLSLSGVIGSGADASTVKAVKLTVSGMIPVVGGMLSDASEAIVLSATLAKNAVGIYGMLTIISIAVLPFIKVGLMYLMMKATSAICKMFGNNPQSALTEKYSTAMGMLTATIGVVLCLMCIGIVCFMKGIS